MISRMSNTLFYPEDRLLKIFPDVAVLTGFSRAKLYRLTKAGVLPTVRIGGSLRVRYQSLLEWMKANESRTCEPSLAPAAQPTDSVRT